MERSRGRPKAALVVSEADRETLTRWTRRHKTGQSLALRARIVLEANTGATNQQVAAVLRTTNATVGKWRTRFIQRGPAGLLDEPRCGAPRSIGDDQVEAVVVRTLEATPKDATHWSVRSMAAASGLSQTTVHRIWRAFGLQPHRTETFKLSNDPQLVEKVRDIVGLYLNPPDHAVVVCIDEKTQIQALDRTQPILAMRPGQAERRTFDYRRHGTTGPALAGPAPALPPSFHADLLVVDQPGGALVRRPHAQAATARHPPEHPPARGRHPSLPEDLQREPAAVRVGQVSRRDSRQHPTLLPANLWNMTLGAGTWSAPRPSTCPRLA